MMPGAAGMPLASRPARTGTSGKVRGEEPVNSPTVLRQVTVRAMRTAAMTASEPVLQSPARSKPVSAQTRSATSPASGCCGPREAARRHDRLGAGVAESGAIEAGQRADEVGDLAGQRMLRPDLVAGVELAAHGLLDELGLPSEQVHAEAVEDVHVLVAVEVPHLRAAAALDHDLVGDLLRERP